MPLPMAPPVEVFRKPVVKPKNPMRPLYWTRIRLPPPSDLATPTNEEDAIIWDALQDAKLEVDEFDGLFSRPIIQKKAKKDNEDQSKAEKVKDEGKLPPASYLDKKKTQNIGIFLRSKNVRIDDVENAIYNLDDSVLDTENLAQIDALQSEVTEEERTSIREHALNSVNQPLDRSDRFIYDLSNLSHFRDRLKCLRFRALFGDALQDIEHRLNNVGHVCDQLLNSESCRQVLSLVWACGNYMNGGNKQRGQADGFAIDILPKLKDVKSRDNSATLLQYVVRSWIVSYDGAKGEKNNYP